MCGITGIVNFDGRRIEKETLSSMCNVISHRGPDDSGQYINSEESVGFGHRRLSIIDLSSGNQPMSDHDEEIWIVFNGEIYNFQELKSELKGKGYNFRTNSDTEVIIYLYKEYGIKSFHRLNGIFAFAIYDNRNKEIILARDHFGVKPLYYYICDNNLIFGSEIKTILASKKANAELDYEALNSFLTFRYNPAPQTLFRGIKKLQASYYLKASTAGDVEIDSYWNYSPFTNSQITETDAINEYQRLLEKAIQRQMISDVPVGLLLSGGVDSAVIGYLMSKYSRNQIKTFTIGFEGTGDFNELSDARETAKFINSDHNEITITQKEYLDFFFRSFHFTEEPIAESTIPALYYVTKLASKHLKVVLAGQGADEPLAGYHRYFGEKIIGEYWNLIRKFPPSLANLLFPRNEKIKRAIYSSNFSDEISRFEAIYSIFTPEQKGLLLNDNSKDRIIDCNKEILKCLIAGAKGLTDSLSRMLFIDTRMTLSDNLLLFGDKMSMANSLEMRVPFLDLELIKFLESLPSELKLKGWTHKYIHKKSLEKWLPDKIIYRKKRPFATPVDNWFQENLSDIAKKLFNDKNSACQKYFNVRYVDQLIDLHRNRKGNFQKQIFMLLSFEIWYKMYFESIQADELVKGII